MAIEIIPTPKHVRFHDGQLILPRGARCRIVAGAEAVDAVDLLANRIGISRVAAESAGRFLLGG